MHKITLINGDGIGQEVIPAAREVLEALHLPLEFQEAQAGFGTFENVGNALPSETLERCENSDAILFGATSSPMTKVEGYQSPILSLRKHFDLFANLRPAISPQINEGRVTAHEMGIKHQDSYASALTPAPTEVGIDMLIVRENTEGLYSRRERVEDDGQTAIAERVITARAAERIVRVACEQAMLRRKKLTLVHKANVLKETCGLFRRVGLEVVQEFPELEVTEQLVDSAAMFMVQNPSKFDVIVTTNLFGDILSDLAAGLTGGLGIAPSANIGEKRTAVFEPVHGSAPDIAGKGIADPRAAILSAAMMLDYLGYTPQAEIVRKIAYNTVHLGETALTTRAIIQQLESLHVY